ncbi:MAG TPA: hypothetical protein VI248_02665, partial [Kineosporiaceae bacterium]
MRGQVDPDAGMPAVAQAPADAVIPALREGLVNLEDQQDRYVLPGVSSPQMMAAHEHAWPRVAAGLGTLARGSMGTAVLLDLGRVGSAVEATALLEVADMVLVICRATLSSLVSASHAASHLKGLAARGECPELVGCLLVADGPYTAREVEESLEVPVIGALACDPTSAAVFSHGRIPGRGFTRSPLLRSAAGVAVDLAAYLS